MTESARISILLVDDDSAVLRTTKRVLSDAGCLVDSTTDPKRAIEMLSAEPYRLLITDVSMPEMSGPELAREAFHIRADVKVLFISGGFEQGVRFRWSDPQLDKPFTPDQLLDEIRKHIGEPASDPIPGPLAKYVAHAPAAEAVESASAGESKAEEAASKKKKKKRKKKRRKKKR